MGEGMKRIKESSESEKGRDRVKSKKLLHRTITVLVFLFATIVAASAAVAVFLMPVIRMSGKSMEPTYQDGDVLVLLKSGSYKSGQICCVKWQNKLLIRRVIGMPGDVINIDESGNVDVNGKRLNEPYAVSKSLGICDLEFPYEVPEGKLFVLGDHRDTSVDSRSDLVGCVGPEQILGRVLFRIWRGQ